MALGNPSAAFLAISPELSYKVPFSGGVFYSQLQGLVVLSHFVDLIRVSLLLVLQGLVELNLLRLHLALEQLALALRFEVVGAQLLNFGCLCIQLGSVLGLEVFLDPHPQDVLVNWKLHLGSQSIQLTVFGLNTGIHGLDSFISFGLSPFARRNLVYKPLLVRVLLILEGLMVSLELRKQFR